MSNKRLLVIECCKECPSYRKSEWKCLEKDSETNPEIIPDWCPLEEAHGQAE